MGAKGRMRQMDRNDLSSSKELLAARSVEEERQVRRLRFTELTLGLPTRGVMLLILAWYLFGSGWFEGLNVIGRVALETAQRWCAFEVRWW